MVNGSYLLDTSAVSKYLDARFNVQGLTFMDSIFETESNISVITKIELLSWIHENQEQKNKVLIAVEDSDILVLNDAIVDKTIELRRKYKIKTPDAIIAATALVNNLTLITDNDRDFLNIKDLQVINPNTVH
jgi:predicted nucleic acid-binding protein